MKLLICILTLLLTFSATAQIDFGGGLFSDEEFEALTGRLSVEQLQAQQDAYERSNRETRVVRRYPYGQHDRLIISTALKEYYGDKVTAIRFPGQWHFTNTFAYLQPLGNFMISTKYWLNESWIMSRWRNMTGDQTAFVSTKSDRYMASYAVTFVTPEKSMECNAYIAEVDQKTRREIQRFKVTIAGCNTGWKFVDQNELFNLTVTAP